MKKALSLFLVVLMLVGMLPMTALNASAAEVSETITLAGSTGTVSGESISWTSGNLSFTANKNTSSTAIRTTDTDHFRLYVGFSATLTCSAGNITKIVMTATGSSYAIAPTGSDGSVGTVSGTTITIVPTASSNTYTIPTISKQTRIKTITVTYATVDSGDCAHTNTEEIAAVAATCTTAGNTAGVKCADCGITLEGNETIEALGHTNDEGVVTAATCTEDGYTLYTCTVCGSTKKSDYVDATGHNYVDGVCSVCSVEMPTGLAGKYYIAAIRSSGNYMYMTNDVGTASTKRYQIVDSGLTELPTSIATAVDAQVFELIFDASTATYKIKTGDQYLGWTSGNSGILVDEATAIAATIEAAEDGAYNIHFTASDAERYLALNSNSSNNYFAWYKQGQAEDLYLIPIDVETPDACTHTTTTTTTVDATCTEAGSTTVVCDDCGETVSTEEIAALGHNIVDNVCERCGTEFEGEIDTPDQPTSSTATIDFSTTEQRVSQDTSSQVWSNGGATVTNNKASSTSNIIDSSNPVRFYKSSEVIIAFTGMTKIEIACNTAAYATALQNSISDTSVSVSVSDKLVTIVPNTAIDSYTITLSGGQVRVDSITVTASTCEHSWGEYVQTSAPTCTEAGVNTSTCSLCGETKTDSIPATGHTYTYVDGAMTCTCGDSKTISTIAEAKAYTSTTQVYYIEGVVTYVNGKTVYMEDATGGICVYFAAAPSDIALGDKIVVWDTMTTYNGLIETTNTTALEYLTVSSGNALPSQAVTLAQLAADTTNEYLGERVVIENVTIGVTGTDYTSLTDADGNSLNIYKVSGLSEDINENDTVTATVIVTTNTKYVATVNGYQLLVNPGTAATDVVETAAGEEEVITTVTIAEAKAGAAGEYYQVEGTVTYISGRNVYIQDATGGIVVYLTANAATTQVGDTVKAYGALKNYNGLLELDAVDETNTKFYEILSSGNTVEPQEVTIADLLADTTNEYLAEKVTLNNVYVSHYSYNDTYKNVTYYLVDGNGNEISVYRVTVASEEECVAGGSIVNVEAVVSTYNGYQLVTTNDKITVVGTCAHETTELVNAVAATCTEAGYTGDTMCTICQNYTARGEEIAALGHTEVVDAAVAATCTETGLTEGSHCDLCNEVIVAQEVIPAGHTIVTETVAPTCTEQGYDREYCEVCGGEEAIENYVAALGHDYTGENGACIRCGEYQVDETLAFYAKAMVLGADIRGIFQVRKIKATSPYESFMVIVEKNGIETELELVATSDKTNYTTYGYALTVPAKEMADVVNATIIGITADGTYYVSNSETWSIKEGAIDLMDKYASNTDEKSVNMMYLCANMLNYGAEAQKKFEYNLDNLATAGLSEAYAALIITTTPEMETIATADDTGATSTLKNIVFNLDARVQVLPRFTVPKADSKESYSAVITQTHIAPDGTVTVYDTVTIDGSDCLKSGTTFAVYIDYLAANELRDVMTVTLYKDGEAVSATHTFSAESVLKGMLDGGSYPTLIPAMMNFCDCARAYFG